MGNQGLSGLQVELNLGNGYYFPNEDPSEKLLPIIWKLNSAFVKRIGDLKRKLHPRSRSGYQPAVIEFLHQESEATNSISTWNGDLELPEEINEAEILYEGDA